VAQRRGDTSRGPGANRPENYAHLG